ncbi:hypothetical protein ILUMI_06396 [Ignelater luminosus]|uniref:Peptidase metallopeptidase domain-containing protein n=1 Tax=Ignelater luminosus TaxID=2038154 RepID=A0A8K0D5I8_IGNLU|nr:hypothetical protein ILUMI_06396 [Ignelater luminosus]
MKFGYLSPSPHSAGALRTEESVRQAIRELQQFSGLPVTGKLDDKTIKLLKRPRCGLPDIEPHAQRRKRFVPQGQRWPYTNLTWSLQSTNLKELNTYEVRFVFSKALEVWARHSKLTFREIDSDRADILVYFHRGDHGDNFAFDGPGQILAHAFFPGTGRGGDAHFDLDENWLTREDDNNADGTSLFQVAAHEFGHSLGLSHSSVEGALMYPWYQGMQNGFNYELPEDDRLGIQALYGVYEDQKWDFRPTYHPPPTPPTPPPPRPTPPPTRPTRAPEKPRYPYYPGYPGYPGYNPQNPQKPYYPEKPSYPENPTYPNKPHYPEKQPPYPEKPYYPQKPMHPDRKKHHPHQNPYNPNKVYPPKQYPEHTPPDRRIPHRPPFYPEKTPETTTTYTYPNYPRRYPERTRRPTHTNYPKERAPPDTCDTNYDAISVIRTEVFIFKDRYFWRIGDNGLLPGYPAEITRMWRDLPRNLTHVDAVYERPDNKIVFFIGKQFYVYPGDRLERGYPKPLTDLGLPASLEKIDGAMVWGHNGKTYFYSGNMYWRFDEELMKVELDYPRDMSMWRGVGQDIDAVFQWKDGKTYFFKGKGFWKFNDLRMRVENEQQTLSAPFWMGCSRNLEGSIPGSKAPYTVALSSGIKHNNPNNYFFTIIGLSVILKLCALIT